MNGGEIYDGGEQAERDQVERMRRALESFGCCATDEYAGKVIRAITNAGPLELGIREVLGYATAARPLNERPERIGLWATAFAVVWIVAVWIVAVSLEVALRVIGCL